MTHTTPDSTAVEALGSLTLGDIVADVVKRTLEELAAKEQLPSLKAPADTDGEAIDDLELLKVEQLASLFDISKRQAEELIASGEIVSVIVGCRNRRVRRVDARAYLHSRKALTT